MRTYTLTAYGSGNEVTVTVPDVSAWCFDNNVIKAVANDSTQQIGIEIYCTGIDGFAYTLTQSAFGHYIVINLADIVRKSPILAHKTGYSITFSVKVYAFGSNDSVMKSVNFFYGRTLPLRKHGNTRLFRSYPSGCNDYNSIDMFFASGFSYKMNGGTKVSIANDTIVTFASIDGSVDNVLSCESNDNGNEWDIMELPADPYCYSDPKFTILIKSFCLPEKAVFVRFTDTDGVKRIVAGKLLKYERSGDKIEYRKNEDIISNGIAAHVTGVQQTLTIGIDEVAYNEYLTDMKFADDIVLARNYHDANALSKCITASVDAIEYEEDGEAHDMVVTFKTMI